MLHHGAKVMMVDFNGDRLRAVSPDWGIALPAFDGLRPGLEGKPPSLAEIWGARARMLRRRGNPWGDKGPDDAGAAAIVSRDPLVVYTPYGGGTPLGMANALRRELAGTPATFLIAVHGSLERRSKAARIRRAAFLHRARHPEHRFVTLCNTRAEQKKLIELGESAVFMNHNMLVGLDAFFPIEGTPRIYDAVYNGRLSPQKRHHLALDVASCAMIFYRTSMEDPKFENALIARHNAEAPGHVFVNTIGPSGPIRLSPAEVNRVYNQAHVGLCLSEVEGAMFASIEYMLSGLPIVSTPSVGGRDVYFDQDYCIVADPDPAAINKAVLELKARNIPRDFVRRRTIAKIEADRQRFLDFMEALQVPLPAGAHTRWPYPPRFGLEWRPWRSFLSEILGTGAAS